MPNERYADIVKVSGHEPHAGDECLMVRIVRNPDQIIGFSSTARSFIAWESLISGPSLSLVSVSSCLLCLHGKMD